MTIKARIGNGIVYSPYPTEPVPEVSIYQVVKQCLEQHGNRTALVWENEDITFSELLKMFQRYAAGFQAHGVKKGDKVLVHLDNSLKNMIAMYSVVFAGGVAVSSQTVLSNEDIIYRIQSSNAAYILTTASEANRFCAIRDQLDNIKGYFATGNVPGFVSVTEFKKLNEKTFREVLIENAKNDVIALFYTSGTTGRPKAIEHTHYSIVACLPRPRSHFIFDDHDVFASWVTISLAVGFRLYLRSCSAGAKIVLFSSAADTEKIVDDMRKYKVTMMLGNVNLLSPLARKVEKDGVRFDYLKTLFISGTIASVKTLRELEPTFDLAIIKNCYGSTEIGGICQPPMGASKWYGIGFPAPMAQLKIVDPQSGKVLGPNEHGELFAKNPSSMKGYYQNPEATSQAITPDGWIRSGDICYYNEDGQFFFVERINQLFRCMGINVAPTAVENVLLKHEGIADAAVIGVPHPKYIEVAMAFVVSNTSGRKITEEELQNFVSGQVGSYMHLHGGVRFVLSIPRDDSGKIERARLRALLEDN